MSRHQPAPPPPLPGAANTPGSQLTPSTGAGFSRGALAGLGGAVGMAVASSVVVALLGIGEGPGTAFGLLFVYLFFGLFLAVIVGPVGGGIMGFGLVALKRMSAAPIVGALTPAIVLMPASLVWGATDDGSTVIEAAIYSGAVSLLYAPFGFLAGKFYAKKMAA